MLTTETEVEAFKRSVALQNELGVPSRIISPDEAIELCPLLAGEDILAASYCPTDAHATPESVVQGYAFGARAHGAHLAVRTPVEGIDVVDGVITGVRTAARDGSRPARSSAPRAPGRARAARWPACRWTSRRCAGRCCSPRRWPTCRPSCR